MKAKRRIILATIAAAAVVNLFPASPARADCSLTRPGTGCIPTIRCIAAGVTGECLP
jgi:hypothetical protein